VLVGPFPPPLPTVIPFTRASESVVTVVPSLVRFDVFTQSVPS
jgi:hypothetical protein